MDELQDKGIVFALVRFRCGFHRVSATLRQSLLRTSSRIDGQFRAARSTTDPDNQVLLARRLIFGSARHFRTCWLVS